VMLMQQLHQTYLLLDGRQRARTRMLDARARRWAIRRRRLRELLFAPGPRIPAGGHHA
jgi:hypothetical protein